jgi:ribosome-associated toxin RatA of RatAB toxin-antitoxin module
MSSAVKSLPIVRRGERAYDGHMVDVRVSGTVRASPDDVYQFLADLENWPRWQSDMKVTELTDGAPGHVGAQYRYVSKAMGQTFDSTVRLSRAEAPREVAFEGEWTGMIRPSGRYLIEPAPEGSRVTLNPHPETRGVGRLMAPLMGLMIKRLNGQHLETLRRAVERT